MSYWDDVSVEETNTTKTEHIKTDPTIPAGFYAC